MRPLRLSWSGVRRRLESKRKLLFLDFDGTLVPIAKDPESIKLDVRTKQVLSRLGVSEQVHLCIISGRRVRTLRSIIGMKDICYVGNHGFEIEAPGFALSASAVSSVKIRRILGPVAGSLKNEFGSIQGVVLEDKRFTLSLHFRNMAHKDLKIFRKKCKELKSRFQSLPLIWREGKKVLEVLPDVRWNKGSAALLVCDRFPGRLPVILGDDKTDEDMFRALSRRGVTIRIGSSKNSAAKYYLDSQKQVIGLLRRLLSPKLKKPSKSGIIWVSKRHIR